MARFPKQFLPKIAPKGRNKEEITPEITLTETQSLLNLPDGYT